MTVFPPAVQANDWKVIPGERIGPLTLSMTQPEILEGVARLGGPAAPPWSFSDTAGTHTFWPHDLLTVTMARGVVQSITTSRFLGRMHPYKTDRRLPPSRGEHIVGIGSPGWAVEEAYRGEQTIKSLFRNAASEDMFVILAYPRLGISFYVQSTPGSPPEIRDRVWAVKVARPDSPALTTPPPLPFNTSRAHDWRIVPGERVGEIRLLQPFEEVERVLGRPHATDRDSIGTHYRWHNHLLSATVSTSMARTVVLGTFWRNGRAHPYITDRGIGIRSTEGEVRDAYRGEEAQTATNPSGPVLLYAKLGLMFFFGAERPDVAEEVRGRVLLIGISPKP